MKDKASAFLDKSPRGLFFTAVLVLCATVGFLVYSDVLANGIFMFDDYDYVLNNQVITDSFWTNITDPRYVGYLSFKFNEMTGGKQSAFGYHLFNVIVHVLNSILVFSIVRQLLARLSHGNDKDGAYNRAVSVLTGLIFVAHPLATQSVSYITQRFTSLSTLFYLLSVSLYLFARVRFEDRRKLPAAWIAYIVAFVSTVLAMKTKEISFTIPFMLLFFELTLFRESVYRRKRYFWLTPFIATLAVIPLSIFGPDMGWLNRGEGVAEITRRDKVFDLTKRSAWRYLLTQFRAIVIYMRLLVFPVNQAVVYDLKTSKDLFEPEVLGSLSMILALMICGGYAVIKGFYSEGEKARCYKLAGIGITWFFVTLSIESSFIPIKDLIFEHRTYLPSVGAYTVLSAVFVLMLRKIILPRVFFVLKLAVFATAVTAALGILAYARNEIWVDEVAFWNDAVRSAPDKPISYHNRAYAYSKRMMYEQAIKDFDRAISYFAGDISSSTEFERGDLSAYNMSKAYTNRANILRVIGQEALAQEDMRRAQEVFRIAAVPDSGPVYARIFQNKNPQLLPELHAHGEELLKGGEAAKAVEIFSRILNQDGKNVTALVNRGNAYVALRDFAHAAADFNHAVELKPDFPMIYHNRGLMYAWSGDRQNAIRDMNRACGLGLKPSCDILTPLVKGEGVFSSSR